MEFVAAPNQTYKLWVRGKAERDSWANDSIWMQFSGATDVNGQPVSYTTVQPGTPVALNNAQLVELRDGRYVVVQQPVTAVSGYRQTINGTVEDVDSNEIKIRTAKERFEIPMRGANQTGIRKGDNVVIDFTFTPTAPAALPR